ncbi:MAG: tetratricopeptide repeat protein [Planctomyces sp.]
MSLNHRDESELIVSKHLIRSSQTVQPFLKCMPATLLLVLLIAGCIQQAETPTVTLERAKILAERSQFEEAVPLYSKAIEKMPENPDAFYLRGVAYENLGLNEKALPDYQKCLELEPEHTDALNNQGVVLAKMERFQDAVAVFSKLQEIAPDNVLAIRNRALSYQDLGQFDDARREFDRAVTMEPGSAICWFQRGNLLLEQKQFAEAEKDYNRTIELDPGMARAWLNRGMARYESGRTAEGLEDLKHAESLDENIVVAGMELLNLHPEKTAKGSADAAPAGSANAEKPISSGSLKAETQLSPSDRKQLEEALRSKGYDELSYLAELPQFRCAVLNGSSDGQTKTILATFADPAGSPAAGAAAGKSDSDRKSSSNEDPAEEENADGDPGSVSFLIPGSAILSRAGGSTGEGEPVTLIVLADGSVKTQGIRSAGEDGEEQTQAPDSESHGILIFDESWTAEDHQVSPEILEVRMSPNVAADSQE